jgi:hypothetical protein
MQAQPKLFRLCPFALSFQVSGFSSIGRVAHSSKCEPGACSRLNARHWAISMKAMLDSSRKHPMLFCGSKSDYGAKRVEASEKPAQKSASINSQTLEVIK